MDKISCKNCRGDLVITKMIRKRSDATVLRCYCPDCNKHWRAILFAPKEYLIRPYIEDVTNIIDGGYQDGVDADGYDENGYDDWGFNRDGEYDRGGRTDELGRDAEGYYEDGYDDDDFDRDGNHKVTKTSYDEEGFNRWGYDKEGYNRRGCNVHGIDRHGYDVNGYNKHGLDRDGRTEEDYWK